MADARANRRRRRRAAKRMEAWLAAYWDTELSAKRWGDTVRVAVEAAVIRVDWGYAHRGTYTARIGGGGTRMRRESIRAARRKLR